MKNYRLLLAGTGLLLVLIAVYHVSFTLYNSVIPFPDTFGRESRVAASAGELPPVVDETGRLVYIQDHQLIFSFADLSLERKVQLPDASLKAAVSYKVLRDSVLWISDGELHMAQMQGLDWGPVETLGKAVAFDAVSDGERLAVALSDDRQIRLQMLTDGRITAVQQLAIQDGVMIKADFSKEGNVNVAVVSDYGAGGQTLWWTEWDAQRNKVLSQAKLYSFQGEAGLVSDIESLNEHGAVRMICLVKEANKADGRLLGFSVPFAQNPKPEPLPIKIMEQGQELRVEEMGNPLVNASEAEIPLIAKGTVYRAKWKDQASLTVERVSAKNRPAKHPILLSNETALQQTAVWVGEKAGGSKILYGTKTDPEYVAAANRIRWEDVTAAVAETGGYLSGSVFAVAASLKWLVLPGLFLLGRRYLQKRYANRLSWLASEKVRYRLAVGLYLGSKLLTLKQFYQPQMLLLMPVWAQAAVVRYLLPLAVSGVVLWLCGTVKRKGAPAGRFMLFALIDIVVTAVWFGYYIR